MTEIISLKLAPPTLMLSARNATSRYREAKKLENSKRIDEKRESLERKRKATELRERGEKIKLRLQLLEIEKAITHLQ